MTKIMCDICGKEIPAIRFVELDKRSLTYQFQIQRCGQTLDICDECQVDLDSWLTNKLKVKSEEDR